MTADQPITLTPRMAQLARALLGHAARHGLDDFRRVREIAIDADLPVTTVAMLLARFEKAGWMKSRVDDLVRVYALTETGIEQLSEGVVSEGVVSAPVPAPRAKRDEGEVWTLRDLRTKEPATAAMVERALWPNGRPA